MKDKASERFNFLLTLDQKQWLISKSDNLKSCGHVLRELIEKAMQEEAKGSSNA
jgi:hypothetical protein